MSPEALRIAHRVAEKVTSGRWLLAIVAGVGFLLLLATRQLDPALAMTFIMLVAQWFYNKDRTQLKPL
jgi:hypothetical protein